ncbi:hypothetical protein A1OK_14930 [Enterovibrio norvegicus FF-454]|uniref:DUF4156 domain-containing protein n=1 Tax=Enterovibrio norvegicus FF-454 TaxID=1185651 RepID=A0A1E5BZB6_9GAMM|nr:DUF4156 domain-containing protein [Enterovibrio norvegicus]OEE58549.1 hypothetical protein A1OK_14930 [Enterovibrio norvegicus FF-454]
MKKWLPFFVPFVLSTCVTTAEPESENINVLWGDALEMTDCEDKGVVVGSQGHWYDFWLIGDGVLTEGAVNQLRNKALERGADTILLYSPKPFSTSVTFLAKAYICHP